MQKTTLFVSSLIPRKLKLYILAGLLTYSFFETPFPFFTEQWIEYCSKILVELTAAGLFRIYTWFPFQCFFRNGKNTTKNSVVKIILFLYLILFVYKYLLTICISFIDMVFTSIVCSFINYC